MEWFKNGRNATRAYLKLHPDVHYNSARVLASRELTKVNIPSIFAFFGLGIEIYMNQLKEGLNAKTPMNKSDHNARFPYFKVLGEVLGFTLKRP